MRLAIISDIHGNVEALEAVLKDVDMRGVEGVLHLGDLVGYGPRPNEAVALVKERGMEGVVGNYDLAVLCDDGEEGLRKYLKPSISDVGRATYEWTREKTDGPSREFLAQLPTHVFFEEGETTYLLTHGSPERPNEYLKADTPPERLDELFKASEAQVMIVGHTHLPMALEHGENMLLLNPGSVGKPKDADPRASYLIVDTEKELRVEHIRVAFNVESVAEESVLFGLPREQADALLKGVST